MTAAVDQTRWRYFELEEFTCKCGCGKNGIDLDFVDRLDELRHLCRFPLIVTSGYRCPEHNQRVSTTGPDGPHTTGKATDVGVSRHRAWEVLRHAFAMEFSGVGVHQRGGSRFLHLDDLREPGHAPRPSVWTY